MLTSLAVMFGVVPIAAVGIVPAMIIFFLVYQLYRYCCIELQRLDNISRSPIQSLLEEILSGGAETIRNFNKNLLFIKRMQLYLDQSSNALYAYSSGNRWMGSRLEAIAGKYFHNLPLNIIYSP